MVDTDGTEVAEQEQVETTEEVQEPTTEETPSDQEEVAEPVYEPNNNYKVYDEEREFDDWAKEVLKAEGFNNKEIEENLRGLYAKAGGFEPLKEKYGSLKDEHSNLSTEHSGLNGEVEELMYYLQNDLGTFFKKLDVSNQKIFDYVQSAIDEEKLDPSQRAQLQSSRESLVDGYQSQREADRLRAENTQLSQNSFNAELDRALSGSDTHTFAKKFDDLHGQGSFRKEVINTGRIYHSDNGRDTTPLDAALQTIEKYRAGVDRVAPVNELEAARKAQEEGKPKGHIPNVGGGSVSQSPTSKRPKDMDEFKKHIARRLAEIKEA